jgi:hypothetical protein
VLKPFEAVAVTTRAPSPRPAVVVKLQLDFAVADVRCPVKAPATSTHSVSELVVNVNVNAPPLFAYRVPPTDTVPAAPVKTALATDEALAAGAATVAIPSTKAPTRANRPPVLRAPDARGNRLDDRTPRCRPTPVTAGSEWAALPVSCMGDLLAFMVHE